MVVKDDVRVTLTINDVKTFTRMSGHTGQEVLVESGSNYPARINAPDVETVDLTFLKRGDKATFLVSLGFTSYQCVSDNDKKYYKRVPTFTIKNIINEPVDDIEIS